MADKLLIEIPEGYSGIDMEKSDFDKGIIVFKKKLKGAWKDTKHVITGFYIDGASTIIEATKMNNCNNQSLSDHNVFVTKEQAKSVLAMAQLSQIIANDERFGGPITDQEWNDSVIIKFVIGRQKDCLFFDQCRTTWCFLAFRTDEQRELFYQENKDLIEQYYMIN